MIQSISDGQIMSRPTFFLFYEAIYLGYMSE